MKQYVFGLMMILAMGGVVFADNETDADVRKLEGAWNIEVLEIMGKKIVMPQGQGGSFVFGKDMKVVIKGPDVKERKEAYKIDASKTPKHIDLDRGEKKEAIEAIYEIDGDNLRIAYPANGPEGKRPAGFKDKKTVIMYLRRKKS